MVVKSETILLAVPVLIIAISLAGCETNSSIVTSLQFDGDNMKMTHYWDCNGQGCDATTLQPFDLTKFISPSGYGPQDPFDFGGAVYGERMWLTGAASDALSAIMGNDDGCCGEDLNDGGVGGCGKCLLIQNPDSLHPDWTAIVMKKNRCPPNSFGCDANKPHFDVAVPGFDNLDFSTANVCSRRPGTSFNSKQQSGSAGKWFNQCANTAECSHLCDLIPTNLQKGCKLFASWGWLRGDPDKVRFKAVACPQEFTKHVGQLFGADGVIDDGTGGRNDDSTNGGNTNTGGLFSKIAGFFRWIWDTINTIVGFFRGLFGNSGTNTVAPGSRATCSKRGDNCLPAECCIDKSHTCFMKDEHFATCSLDCTEGIHQDDPVEFRTPWTCNVIGLSEQRPLGETLIAPVEHRWPHVVATTFLGLFFIGGVFLAVQRGQRQWQRKELESDLENELCLVE